MTQKALTLNREWNTKLISTEEGTFATALLKEFEDLWDSDYAYAFQDFIDTYRTAYRVAKEQRRIAKQAKVPSLQNYRLKPNSMQVEFINRLEKIREDEEILSRQDAMEEFMFLGLRMTQGISTAEFEEQFGKEIHAVYGRVLKKYEAMHLLQEHSGRLALTRDGISVSNVILADFLL